MKDYAEATWREGRPDRTAKEAITFCLEQLFKDKQMSAGDTVAGVCTYEELIGTLLLAEDELKSLEEAVNELEELME